MVSPNQIQISAFDTITELSALPVVAVLVGKGEIAEMPEDIVLSNRLVDVVDDGVVHQLNRLIGDPPVARTVALPGPIVPGAAIPGEGILVCLGQEWAITIFDYITMGKMRI
jgi:hypothetical protein